MFPGLQFIGHSTKFWAEISGDLTPEKGRGLHSGKVAPNGRITELMRKYPNLTCDLSANSGWNAMVRDPEFTCGFMEEFADRLYYGTDICAAEQRNSPMLGLAAFLDELMESRQISYDTYYKISRGNAEKLLGLN